MARVPRSNVIVEPINPRFNNDIKSETKKLRVTFYARVSTDKEEQQTSLDGQIAYYQEKIASHENWTMVGPYIDEGKSGTDTKHRVKFNEMIKDCKAGKIDLILTKSISRFARNTVDTLVTVRDLQKMGVSVIFEKENINTATQDCEMLITIFSSIAQEESRSISENIRWAFKAKFERGEVMLCTNRYLGLDRDKDNNIVINEEEAKVVRLMAMLYLSGMSYEQVARELDRRKIKTVTGKDRWSASTVRSILRNEKNAGILIQGKSFTVDFLKKQRKKNKGERPKYKSEGDIPAILPMSVFMRLEEERLRRSYKAIGNDDSSEIVEGRRSKYALSDLLRCHDCGSPFRRVSWRLGGKLISVYRCKSTQVKTIQCHGAPTLRESDIERNVLLAINDLKENDTKDKVYPILLNNIKSIIEKADEDRNTNEIDEEIKKLKENINQLIEQGMNGFEKDPNIDLKIVEQAGLLKQLQIAKTKMMDNKSNDDERMNSIKEYIDKSRMNVTEFDDTFMRRMIDRIEVFSDASIEIHFKFGVVVKRQLESAKNKNINLRI